MENFCTADILLVEDNPQDVELTLRTLEKNHLANQVFVVTDGEEALDFLFCRAKFVQREPRSPKVIFLDIKLPKVNGLEVLKIIKQDKRLRNTPVVMLTSSAEDPDVQAAYQLGANSYVVKPVDFRIFAETIINLGLYWLVVNQSPK
ncbi:MAG: response regulator [Bacteroidota bacterium]